MHVSSHFVSSPSNYKSEYTESRDTTSTNKTLTSGDTSSILTNTRIDLCPYSVSGEHKAQAVMKVQLHTHTHTYIYIYIYIYIYVPIQLDAHFMYIRAFISSHTHIHLYAYTYMYIQDNDLREKIRLPPILARQVYRQLEVDAKFLRSLGVMDYSLLIGVHTTEYDMVEQHNPSFLNRNSKVSAKLDDRRLQVSKIVGNIQLHVQSL